MKQREYVEGPEATRNFKGAMTAIFAVPKKVVNKKRQRHKAATVRKAKKADNGKV